ncbi:MAG TPA: fibronectin type III domain-containing protein, partial [Flavobacterium sp.]|nr:fibronectin type III domain-containing protein [Flavobacterium sp.]
MKIKIYSLLLLISVIFTGNSQVLIGQGNTTTGQFTPFKPYWRYTYSQSIYLSSEINASGKITSIEWYFEGTTAIPNSDNITVYMSTTSKTSFGSTSDWIPVANMTKVFEGAIVMNSPIGTGWKKITLTTPFDYDGISNLVIATDENDPETESPDLTQNFYNFDTGNNRSIYAVNGTTDINPLSPPVANNLKTFVPNIIIGGIAPACETPQYLSVSNVTQTTATVSWQNLVNTIPSRGSEYYISTSTNKPNDSTIPTGAINGGTSANLTNLQPGTTYLVYVRNNCADGINSSWSPAVKLTTSCPDSYDTFYENFDSLNTSPKNLPNCWSKIIRANAGSNICPSAKVDALVSEANATSGTNSVYMSNCNSDGDYDIILISPALSNLDKGTHRLIFNSKGGILEVGTLDNNTADAKFTLFKTYDESNQNAFTNTILNFDNYIGTDKYIGIRVKQTNPQQTYFYIDDISWSAIPNCPDVTQVKATEVTDITATIGWSDAQVGGAESWDIAVGDPSVTNPDLLPFNNTPDSGTYLIENLQPATQYKAWVRSVCTGNEKGAYVGPVLFTTNCATVTDFNESFDSAPLGGLPQCWSKIVKPNSGVLGVQSNVAAT